MSTLEAFLNHPIETLERALHIRKQIDQLNEVLKELFGPSPVSLGGVQATAAKKRGRPRKINVAVPEGLTESGAANIELKKKRKMSAAAKAKIAAAQRVRWATVKAEKSGSAKAAPETKKKKKRTISAAHRAKLKAAAKARWAGVKKGFSDKGRKQIGEAGQPKFKIF